MDTITLLKPPGLVASPAFSHVAVVPPGATMIYVGGQNSVDETGALVGDGDPAAQTRRTMANLVTALEAGGAGLGDVISMTVLLDEGVDVSAAYGAAAERLATLETAAARDGGDRERARRTRCSRGGGRGRGRAALIAQVLARRSADSALRARC